MSETSIVITAQAGQAEGTMRSLGDSIDGVSKRMLSMSGLANTLGGALSLTAFATFITSTNNGVDALNDLYDATGSSIENLSALEDRAARTGTGMDKVGATLVKFNNVLNEAKPGSGQELALKAIGLNAAELQKLDPAEALRQTAVALNQFADDGNKARLVQDLFGKGVREMAPLLKDLAEGGALVAKVTTEQAKEAEKFNNELAVMQKNATDAHRALVGDLVVGINKAAQAMRDSGLVEAMRVLLTGDDQYKNNKRLVELTNDLLRAENALSASRSKDAQFGDKSVGTVAAEKRLAGIKAELQTVQSMRQVLDQGVGGATPAGAAAGAAAGGGKKSVGALIDPEELKKQNALLFQMGGLTSGFYEDWERLSSMYKSGRINLEQLTEAQAELLSKQPAMKEEAETVKKINEGHVKSAEAVIASDNEIEAIERERLNRKNAEADAQEANWQQGLAQRIAALQTVAATEAEIERGKLTEIENDLFLAKENGWLTEQQYLQMREQAQLEHEAKMGNIMAQGELSRRNLSTKSWDTQALSYAGMLKGLTQQAATSNKEMFELNKAAGISEAIVNTYRSAQGAYAALAGIPYVGPFLGAAAAAVAIAAGVANVNAISSAQFGGTSAPSIAGGNAIPTYNAGPTSMDGGLQAPGAGVAQQRQQITLNFQGSGKYTYDEVATGIVPLIQEAVGNGVDIIVNRS